MRDAINDVKSKNWQSCIASIVPAVKWLSQYNWRENILPDVISGLTVAIMHIPQGMAYALLGNLPPVVGIYMAFFPVFIYFLFGTSRHVSIGESIRSDKTKRSKIYDFRNCAKDYTELTKSQRYIPLMVCSLSS